MYIDGKSLLDKKAEQESIIQVTMKEWPETPKPRMRSDTNQELKHELCSLIQRKDEITVIKGIKKSFLLLTMFPSELHPSTNQGLTLVLKNNKLLCIDLEAVCFNLYPTAATSKTLQLSDGHLLPGITALSIGIGLSEIEAEEATRGGPVSPSANPLDEGSVIYAKYGLHFGSKLISRAKAGGITKVITPPLHVGGLLQGVSVGFRTTARNILNDWAVFEGL